MNLTKLDMIALREGRNPFVSQVNSDNKFNAQQFCEDFKSQSLRKSGQFWYEKKINNINPSWFNESQSLRKSGQFWWIVYVLLMTPFIQSQSLRKSGQFWWRPLDFLINRSVRNVFSQTFLKILQIICRHLLSCVQSLF